MKQLLSNDNPVMMRRLVRVLNGQEHGFYTNGQRFMRARFHKGQIQVLGVSGESIKWQRMGFDQYFSNAYGEQLVASRTA